MKVVKQLSCVAESVQELSVNALLNFTKLLSVILKVNIRTVSLGIKIFVFLGLQ